MCQTISISSLCPNGWLGIKPQLSIYPLDFIQQGPESREILTATNREKGGGGGGWGGGNHHPPLIQMEAAATLRNQLWKSAIYTYARVWCNTPEQKPHLQLTTGGREIYRSPSTWTPFKVDVHLDQVYVNSLNWQNELAPLSDRLPVLHLVTGIQNVPTSE